MLVPHMGPRTQNTKSDKRLEALVTPTLGPLEHRILCMVHLVERSQLSMISARDSQRTKIVSDVYSFMGVCCMSFVGV